MAGDLGPDGRLFPDRSGPVVVSLNKPGSSQDQASLDELTMESEWEIKSRAHCCARTGKQFGQGEYFYTLLFREREGFRREDISEEAWANRNENIEPFSFWRSKWGSSSNRVKIYCSVLYATLLCPLVTDY
jgi:hypothetical protein